MKTLLLLRHAKSSWGDSSATDFERPLAPRGIADAPRIGHALRRRVPQPDLILSSPAVRATQTVEAVVAAAALAVTPQFDQNIYGASSGELLQIVRRIPNTVSSAMLVGHNPAFSETVSRLTETIQDMPTAALACIEFQIDDWADVEDGAGTLAWMITPKLLGGKATD